MACAIASATSRSWMTASEKATYGPNTLSPSEITPRHIARVFIANELGRTLTHGSPQATAARSTSVLRSPSNRDG